MRCFGAFEIHALVLYKWKTPVTQIVRPQPTHATKITLAGVACPYFGIAMRSLSNKEEKALRDGTNNGWEGDYSVRKTNAA